MQKTLKTRARETKEEGEDEEEEEGKLSGGKNETHINQVQAVAMFPN